MSELGDILAAFHEATACNAAVWRRDKDGGALSFIAGTARGDAPPDEWLPASDAIRDEATERGRLLIVPVGGMRPPGSSSARVPLSGANSTSI